MTDWRAHLTPDEAARLAAIPLERKALTAEGLRIYERAKKRALRAQVDAPVPPM